MRTATSSPFPRRSHRDPLTAGLLAAVPGAGHVYAGEALRGATFLMGTLAGMVLFIAPGAVLWAASIIDAVRCARRRNEAAPPLDLETLQVISDGPDPAPSMPRGQGQAATPSGPWPESSR